MGGTEEGEKRGEGQEGREGEDLSRDARKRRC